MGIEFRCRVCGRLYVPSHADIVDGPDTYRTCPDCRPGDKLKGISRPDDPGTLV